MKFIEINESLKQHDDLDRAIDRADHALEHPAEYAITAFVGVGPGAVSRDEWGGVMSSRWLEDAFDDNPSERGIEIRKQLEKAFSPIRAQLKSIYGDRITLYRAQLKYPTGSVRNVLSWTFKPRIANWFAGIPNGEMVTPYSDEEIRNAVQEYERTGKTIMRRVPGITLKTTYIRSEENPDYYHIYQKGELITDGDDLEDDLKTEQKYHEEVLAKQKKNLENVKTAEIPIDAIIWITDRAGQEEAIVKNTGSWKL